MTYKPSLVTNASPVIHLARMQRLDILVNMYGKIYCSKAVEEDIKYPKEAVDFIKGSIAEVVEVKNQPLVESILRKHPRLKKGEVETYALYTELSADESLFLNNEAEKIFSREYGGNIKDVIDLPTMDVNGVVFKTEEDKDAFYLQLDKVVPGYRRLQKILQERKLK